MRGKTDWITPFYGQHDAFWLGFYEAFVQFNLAGVQKMRGLIELGKHAGWVWMFDWCAIITERPIFKSLDKKGRLHSLTRKAIEYRDGWGTYMIHGVDVDERLIINPGSITAFDIRNAVNDEVKRALMARFRCALAA